MDMWSLPMWHLFPSHSSVQSQSVFGDEQFPLFRQNPSSHIARVHSDHMYIHIGCTYSTLISLPVWCTGTVSIWMQTLPSILTETISTHSYHDNGYKYMHVHAVSYTFSARPSCPGNITCALSWLCTYAIFTGGVTYRCVAGSAIPALHTCTCCWGCACPSIGTCVVADSFAVLDVYYMQLYNMTTMTLTLCTCVSTPSSCTSTFIRCRASPSILTARVTYGYD